jgi:type I restriction enzyme R subunit
MGAFIRLYTFLSQIFDYGNTAIEKRAIFYKRLLPLLEFGREREGIDLSKVVLTHHHLKNLGKQAMPLGDGEKPKLYPITEAGSGSVQEKEKAWLNEIIEKVNTLFEGDTHRPGQAGLREQRHQGQAAGVGNLAAAGDQQHQGTVRQSPDLKTELLNAIMGALDAHNAMSTQALNSPTIQGGMKDILLNHAGLYETLRQRATPSA